MCWEVELHGGWTRYDNSVQSKLNIAYVHYLNDRQRSTFTISINGQTFLIDFVNKTQTNVHTNRQRAVRCSPLPKASPAAGGGGGGGGLRWEVLLQPDEGGWTPYDDSVQGQLNDAKARGETSVTLTIKGFEYTIDLAKRKQTKTATKYERDVRCIPEGYSSSDGGSGRQYWVTDGKAPFKLYVVESSSFEYQEVESLFKATKSNANIISIERVENAAQHAQFMLIKEQHEDKLNGRESFAGSVVKRLFHGTHNSDKEQGKNLPKKLAERVDQIVHNPSNGFQPLYSGSTTGAIYGDGTYFARDASYSHSYAAQLSGGRRQMIMAEVAVGRFTKGKQGMKDCPPIRASEPHVKFDSLVDDVQNPTIHVIQHGAQAYPAYVITYS